MTSLLKLGAAAATFVVVQQYGFPALKKAGKDFTESNPQATKAVENVAKGTMSKVGTTLKYGLYGGAVGTLVGGYGGWKVGGYISKDGPGDVFAKVLVSGLGALTLGPIIAKSAALVGFIKG